MLLLILIRFFSGMLAGGFYAFARTMKGMKEPDPYPFLLTVSAALCVWVLVAVVHDVLDLLGRPQ